MSQSYKPIVAMAIFDLAQEEINRDAFVQRVSEFFWQLERRFSLNHGPVSNDVQQQIKACMDEQENETWPKVWRKLGQTEGNKTRAPRDFIWTKLREMPLKKLPSSTTPTLYRVTADAILLPQESLATIQANKKALIKLARCILGEFLERFNSTSPRINQKVKIAWEKKRPSLPSSYTEALNSFHVPAVCYICDSTISGTPDWDHVIPFSHIGGHDLWNLMPACGTNSETGVYCNQQKSAGRPTEEQIDATERRNQRMLSWMKSEKSANALRKANKLVQELEHAATKEELRRLWTSMI
tara:strand:- start:635 stop:1528 length:894 start_codon:yes stop_codon:yes gene_type:complete